MKDLTILFSFGNSISGKILLHWLQTKNLFQLDVQNSLIIISLKEIHQYLRFFALRYSPRAEIASENITFSWLGPDMPSHAQNSQDFARILLDRLGSITKLQNERSIIF